MVAEIWHTKGKQADLESDAVQKAVWGKSDLKPEVLWESRFHYARREANRFFRDNAIPLRVEKVRGSGNVAIVNTGHPAP